MIRISGATLKERKLIKEVEQATFEFLNQENFFIIDMVIVDGKTIQQLNRETRNIDKVTDVLSYPSFEKLVLPVQKECFSQADYDGKRIMLGSIMICRDRAIEQAQEYGHSIEREIGFLACHGFLHILGFDHIDPNDEKVMIEAQKKIMEKVGLER